MDLNLTEIPGAVEMIEGFPRVHWPVVHQAAQVYCQHPAYDQIWTELAAQWCAVIRRHVGENYRIFERHHLLLLSPQSTVSAKRMLELGDVIYERLEKLLQRPVQARGLGKHVILMFESQEQYYDYIAYYYPDSRSLYGTSSGMFLSRGYRHTVLNGRVSGLRTLAHELAHNMVYDLPLPLWVNEGLAQFMEDMVPGGHSPQIDSRQARLQRRYWSWFGMDHFWDGSAFRNASSQNLGYQLANVLFRNLANHREYGAKLHTFLATAHRNDAGQSACKDCFGCSLSSLVVEFLGSGVWDPKTNTQAGT